MIPLAEIERRVTAVLGLVPRAPWSSELPEGVLALSERSGRRIEEVVDHLLTRDEALLDLAEFLTVGETYFLRCPEHFARVSEHVAAALVRSSRPEPVRVWSAGCATGEEVYSAAIAIASRVDPHLRKRVQLIGSDANAAAIHLARRGVYRPWSFRGASPAIIARYTEPAGDDGRQVLDAIRGIVSFRHASVQRELGEGARESIDVVLFRNVAIYLGPAALAEIYEGFARVLRADGLLLVAPSDPRPPADLFENAADPTTSVYTLRTRPAPGHVSRPVPTRLVPAPRSDRPLRVGGDSRAPVTTAPKISAEHSGEEAGRAARTLADRGRLAEALDVLARWLRREPDAGAAHALRGQILLAAGRAEEGVEDLRRAVYLAAKDPLIRFWHASALHALGRLQEAHKQLGVVLSLLSSFSPENPLSDGETRARELTDAASFLKESIE